MNGKRTVRRQVDTSEIDGHERERDSSRVSLRRSAFVTIDTRDVQLDESYLSSLSCSQFSRWDEHKVIYIV